MDWLVWTIQIHTTVMLGAAQRAHVRRTVHRRCRRGRRGSGSGVTSYKSAASVQDQRRRAAASVEDGSLRRYRLHSGGAGGGLETSRGGASEGPEPVDIEG